MDDNQYDELDVIRAKAICEARGQPLTTRIVGSKDSPKENWRRYLPEAVAIRAADEEAGYTVVKTELTIPVETSDQVSTGPVGP